MVFGWGGDNHEEAYNQVYDDRSGAYDDDNQPKFSHEAVGGAAAFFAMREYEKHQAENGQPPSHQFAKELMAGIAGAEVDRLAETKGMDFLDREKAKRQASREASNLYDQNYGNQDVGNGGGNWEGLHNNYQQQYGDSYQRGGYNDY
ncbi:hypothetical protein ABBQ32_006998 [Trebouxia sp. C0010 RCD-2024]